MACTFSQDAQTDRSAWPQPMKAPEAYPLGYVEDAFKAKTPLTACFNILPVPAFVSDQQLGYTGQLRWCSVHL